LVDEIHVLLASEAHVQTHDLVVKLLGHILVGVGVLGVVYFFSELGVLRVNLPAVFLHEEQVEARIVGLGQEVTDEAVLSDVVAHLYPVLVGAVRKFPVSQPH